jgi:hypothetical protein
VADVDERESSYRVIRKESSGKLLSILGFLGVLTKSIYHIGFGLFEELIVSNVG